MPNGIVNPGAIHRLPLFFFAKGGKDRPVMAGRQAFLDRPQAAGVEDLIDTSGTTELPLMEVLPEYPEMKYRLVL